MKKAKDQGIKFIAEEERRKYIKEIIAFFYDARGEEIGIVAAGEVLDFFLASLGGEIYKAGIKDVKKIIKEKMEDLDLELDILAPNDFARQVAEKTVTTPD